MPTEKSNARSFRSITYKQPKESRSGFTDYFFGRFISQLRPS
jgi:hypothetical protein